MANAKPKQQIPSNWEIASEDVLSVLLNDEGAWLKAYVDFGLRPLHMPTETHKALFTRIISLRRDGVWPLTDTVIRDQHEHIPLTTVNQIIVLYDALRRDSFEDNMKIVHRHGMDKGYAHLLQTALGEIPKRGWQAVNNSLMTVAPSFGTEQNIRNETAGAFADYLEQSFNETPPVPRLTGILWLDHHTGGMRTGEYWILTAPYKGRKTSTMLNLVVGMMRTAQQLNVEMPSVAVFNGEQTRSEIWCHMEAMLATAYLYERGLFNESSDNYTKRLGNINGEHILKFRNNYYKGHHPKQVEAVRYARATLKAFGDKLRLYDPTDEGGNLTSYTNLLATMERDRYLHDLEFAFVEHLGLFHAGTQEDRGGNQDYARMMVGSNLLRQYVKQHSVTIVAATQQTEEANKRSGDTNSHSPNMRGGGHGAQDANHVIRLRYSGADAPNDLYMEYKFGRNHGRREETVQIAPYSGLILPPYSTWFKDSRFNGAF